ncbi:MAG TPA: arylesterase [Burkholderiales bacterium]|nr:arylesterase [Burkholderiales bacterium]
MMIDLLLRHRKGVGDRRPLIPPAPPFFKGGIKNRREFTHWLNMFRSLLVKRGARGISPCPERAPTLIRLLHFSRALLIALSLWLPLAAGAATIMVYGDSLSAGYGVPQGQGWVALLQQRLQHEDYDYKIANRSISGETTAGGRSRIAAALDQDDPAIVIVELGANDGLRGQSIAAMRGNLAAIIEACRNHGAGVLLIGIRLPPNYGKRYITQFHDVFGELAKQYQLPLVPLLFNGFAGQLQYFQSDGMHPNVQGQPPMLDNVWKALQPMLEKQD